MLNAVKDVGSEPFVTNSAIVTFDIGVLSRLTRLGVAKRYVVLAGPLNELATDIFRAIIHAYHCRFATPRNNLVKAAYDSRRW